MSVESEKFYEEKLKYLDGEALKRQIFNSFRILITKLSNNSPLVLIFEDLHWADEASRIARTYFSDSKK